MFKIQKAVELCDSTLLWNHDLIPTPRLSMVCLLASPPNLSEEASYLEIIIYDGMSKALRESKAQGRGDGDKPSDYVLKHGYSSDDDDNNDDDDDANQDNTHYHPFAIFTSSLY